ncbi:hypothetical protein [Herbidospora sp. RD11066]
MTLANHHRVRVTSSGPLNRTTSTRRAGAPDTAAADASTRACPGAPTSPAGDNRGTTLPDAPLNRTRTTVSAGEATLAGGDRSQITALTDVPAVVHEFAEALPVGPVANSGRQVVVAVTDGTWQVEAAAPHRGD